MNEAALEGNSENCLSAAKRARAVAPSTSLHCNPAESEALVGNHALQLCLIRRISYNGRVQLVLTLARLGGEDVPSERVLADNLTGPGFFEPFGRTFMGL
jgi:hypothetical protein